MNILGYVKGTQWDEMDGTQFYRAYLPLREVNSADNGIEAVVLNDDQIIGRGDEDFRGYNIFAWPRMSHVDIDEFLRFIHSIGAKLTIDADDDLTEDYKMVSGHGDEFKTVIGAVDHVTCTTQALADHLGQYTQRPPTVLRNHVDIDWMVKIASKAKRVIEGLTIGFSGSPTHWGDWYIPAVPLSRIVKDYDVTPIVHGEVPRYLNYIAPKEQLVRLGGVPYSIYPAILRQFDIVLCAVDGDDKFNSGKSAVKALESMAVGAVPICSRFGPYLDLAKDGAPIVLVEENTRKAWYYAMSGLIEDNELREMMSRQGPEWVRENRDMRRSGYKLWADFYRSIV